MKLVLAEKPSVAMSLSKVIGANQRGDGYMEGPVPVHRRMKPARNFPSKVEFSSFCI